MKLFLIAIFFCQPASARSVLYVNEHGEQRVAIIDDKSGRLPPGITILCDSAVDPWCLPKEEKAGIYQVDRSRKILRVDPIAEAARESAALAERKEANSRKERVNELKAGLRARSLTIQELQELLELSILR